MSQAKLTKIHIRNKLSTVGGLSVVEAENVTNDFFSTLKTALKSRDTLKISGFGKFKTAVKKARPGRNPRNNTPVEVSARRVVTFEQSEKLQKVLNDF